MFSVATRFWFATGINGEKLTRYFITAVSEKFIPNGSEEKICR